MAEGYFLIKTNSKKHVINARRWDMIDVIDLLRFRTTKLEIHLDSIFSFVFLFQVQALEGHKGSIYLCIFTYSILPGQVVTCHNIDLLLPCTYTS